MGRGTFLAADGQAGQFTRTWQRHSHLDPLICGSFRVHDLLARRQVITTATVPESNDGVRIWWVVHLLKHNVQSTKRPAQQNTDTHMALQGSSLTWSIHLSGENVPLPVSLYNSEGHARQLAREKLGKNPVNVGDNKWRSADGRWQYPPNLSIRLGTTFIWKDSTPKPAKYWRTGICIDRKERADETALTTTTEFLYATL